MARIVERPEEWAIVEIMGHRIISGRVSEVTRFGAPFCRVEVDLPDGTIAAQEYSGSAIFCITPSDEATVRRRQASGTYAGPLVIDPPATVALMARRQAVAAEIADRLAPSMVEDSDDDDHDNDTHCENCSRTTGYPDEEEWDGSQHDEGTRIWFCPVCAGNETTLMGCRACAKSTKNPRAEGWVLAEDHDPAWMCPDCFAKAAAERAAAARPAERTPCPTCGQPLGFHGDCLNFGKCSEASVPF